MSLNVLVTAASRRVPLVRAFRKAVASIGGRVVVCDVNGLSPAVHVAHAAYKVPFSTDIDYLDAILDICRLERIGLLVPTIDDEIPLFGSTREHFEPLGVSVAASPEATARLCNDKYTLCERLRASGIAAAESWLPGALPADPTFPLFIKPRTGRGGVNAFPIRNQRELDFFLDYVPNPVVQEFLVGPEYTIDVLCGFDRIPRAIVPRSRVVIRSGVSDRGVTVADPTLVRLALDCTAALDFVGAVNIQCRVVNGKPTVFEINPRFSGGIPLTIAAGADFPKMLVDLVRGREVPSAIGRFRPGLWMTNYEESLYLDDAAIAALQPIDESRVAPAIGEQVA